MRNFCICYPGWVHGTAEKKLLDDNMDSILSSSVTTKVIHNGDFWGHDINVYGVSRETENNIYKYYFGNVWGTGADRCFRIPISQRDNVVGTTYKDVVIGSCAGATYSLDEDDLLNPNDIRSNASRITSEEVDGVGDAVKIITSYIIQQFLSKKGLSY